jgi:glycosyltransferase involved in cell wall biosynthesis
VNIRLRGDGREPGHAAETASDVAAGAPGRLKVLFVSRDFPPVSHSGTLRSEAFARHLPDFGIDPLIVTSRPDPGSGSNAYESATLEGWHDDPRWLPVSRVTWIDPHPLGARTARLGARVPVVAGLVSQRRRWRLVRQLIPAVELLVAQHSPSAVYASAMPSETLLLAAEIGRRHGLPVLADLRDPWSYHCAPPYRHVVDFWLERALERRTLSACTRVITNTTLMQHLLVQKLGVPAERILLIPNGYDESDFTTVGAERAPLESGRFTIIHAGQLASDKKETSGLLATAKRLLGFDYDPLHVDFTPRSPRYLLAALRTLIDHRPELRDRLRVWFVGTPNGWRTDTIERFPFPEVLKLVPRVDPATAAEYVARADLLFLPQNRYFLRGEDYCVCVPAKLYAYLRSGRRVLACVQPSEVAQIVERLEAGTVVSPVDVDAIAGAISGELERWSVGREQTVRIHPDVGEYDRRRLTGLLASALRQVVVPSGDER